MFVIQIPSTQIQYFFPGELSRCLNKKNYGIFFTHLKKINNC